MAYQCSIDGGGLGTAANRHGFTSAGFASPATAVAISFKGSWCMTDRA
jgi:hypothetical protein